ncbi:hypothetical protein ABPG75_003027 [Micractinium tetrahymenae]
MQPALRAARLSARGAPSRARTLITASATQAKLLAPRTRDAKVAFVDQLLEAKAASGKSFDDIAAECGWTNAYTAQLLFNQAQLKPESAGKLKTAVPQISDEALAVMQQAPMRGWDPELHQEPHVYRMLEAVSHYGEALKAIINEKFGDGIMSAIDFYCTVDKVQGKQGENRVVITFNGKFLPHVEQRAEDNTAATGAK